MKRSMMVLAMVVIGWTAGAQTTSFGINGGFGHTWIDHSNSKFRPAGNLGVSLIYSSKSRFAIGADLKYSLEGGNAESGPNKTFTSLNYVRLPLKAMYFFGNIGQRVRPKITVGPSLGYLTGGSVKIETANPQQNLLYKSRDIYNTIDIGLNASAGIHYRIIRNTWFSADVAYYKGLRSIVKNTRYEGLYFTSPYHSNNITFNVGVNWGI